MITMLSKSNLFKIISGSKSTNPEWSKYLSIINKVQQPYITDEIRNKLIHKLCSTTVHQDLLASKIVKPLKTKPSTQRQLNKTSNSRVCFIDDPENDKIHTGVIKDMSSLTQFEFSYPYGSHLYPPIDNMSGDYLVISDWKQSN